MKAVILEEISIMMSSDEIVTEDIIVVIEQGMKVAAIMKAIEQEQTRFRFENREQEVKLTSEFLKENANVNYMKKMNVATGFNCMKRNLKEYSLTIRHFLLNLVKLLVRGM